ncbi:MAG: hypothetical protein LBE56_05010 [Tannerella sp.]|jgi:hypothetical protein|nr:hypothetical protein [Tannerella sp.]
MILTKHFLNKAISTLSKSAAERTHYYRSLNEIKHILLFCEAKYWKNIFQCIESLKTMGKHVHVCVYTQKTDDTPIWDYAYVLVEAEKDINLWGFPDNRIKKQINGMSIDMLLDLTSGEIPVMRYLMLQHPAPFKVGAKRAGDEDFYDLSIVMKDGEHDIPFLFGQIINYLKTIRSKKEVV